MGQMELQHLVVRLESLAAWRTPGAPVPAGAYPFGEHLFLRDAATRLLRLAADVEFAGHVVKPKGEQWRHWGVLNAKDELVLAASLGREAMHEHVRDMMHLGTTEARNWIVRPLLIGHTE